MSNDKAEATYHPRRNTDADHVARIGNTGKSLVEKIQDHLDGLVWASNNSGFSDVCLELAEASGCAAALGILRSTSVEVEMDLANERLGLR